MGKIFLFVVISVSVLKVFANEPDWSAYQTVLNHVQSGEKNGITLILVDYSTVKSDGSIDKAYRQLSVYDPAKLSGPNERLAFYINAYNILAIKLVADHWPLESIKDLGNFLSPVWDKPAGIIGGKQVTLGEIEHKILRTMGDPRIHMAIVCASVSCPDLLNKPYLAKTLEQQLDDQTIKFLGNPGKGLKIENNAIHISRIFDWFGQDFKEDGGVNAFITRYKPNLPGIGIKADLPYDWDVNSP